MSEAKVGLSVTPVPTDSALSVASVEAGGVRLPSTLWPDSVPRSAWVRTAASSVAALVIKPVWASPPRLPTNVRSWGPIQMPLPSLVPGLYGVAEHQRVRAVAAQQRRALPAG